MVGRRFLLNPWLGAALLCFPGGPGTLGVPSPGPAQHPLDLPGNLRLPPSEQAPLKWRQVEYHTFSPLECDCAVTDRQKPGGGKMNKFWS